MKVAVIGSREISRIDDFSSFLPPDTDTVISGGARGVDQIAKRYALMNGMEYIEFLPDYYRNGSRAPLIRNDEIIRIADIVLAFWDGHSSGTAYVIRRCRETGKPFRVFVRRKKKPKTDPDQISFFSDKEEENYDIFDEPAQSAYPLELQ